MTTLEKTVTLARDGVLATVKISTSGDPSKGNSNDIGPHASIATDIVESVEDGVEYNNARSST